MLFSEERLAWLPGAKPSDGCETPVSVARFELAQALPALRPGLSVRLETREDWGERWSIARDADGATVTGGPVGVLYGAYRLLTALYAGGDVPVGDSAPFYALRMLDCWDNADGSVERGYSGRSLFFEGNRLCYDPARVRELGRLLASVGINVLCVNNVNVYGESYRLLENEWLPDVAALAALLRPYGVRLMLSVDFAHPLRHGLGTADPLDEGVRAWWRERAAAVYAAVPDLAGFLVKADSEHRPGPFTYGRDHAQGADMLADALRPYGGVLVWRCFVYNCQQDWRDGATDRPSAAYEHYVGLDGRFADNVILQVKYGPYDFQVREPVSPLLLAMPRTRLAVEVQLAQEYTGQQIDLFAMPPMWRTLLDVLPERIRAVAAVSNLGRDANYTGHPFAAVNLFAYGRMAWSPAIAPEAVVREWCRLTYHLPPAHEDALCALLMGSARTYEKYTSPLGLGWMVTPNVHYGPCPGGYEFQAWGTYHRADREAVGIDRTDAGTGMTAQYPEPLRSLYASPDTCPDTLKLFFHRMRYDAALSDGRTLIQRIYDDHFEGLTETLAMAETLRGLPLPSPDREIALERMERQCRNAREWCDVINTFFHRLSGAEDARGRKIYP